MKLAEEFKKKNLKLSLIEFVQKMMEIIPKQSCPLKFMKNLLQLFGNIDTDKNLIMEWNELLEYILTNGQFAGKQLLSSLPENERLEQFHSNRSNFSVRFGKKKMRGLKKFAGKVFGEFHDDGNKKTFVLLNFKNCKLDIFAQKFVKPTSFE